MKEYPMDYYWYYIAHETGKLVHAFEILKTFFSNYHITPIWTNCNYTWGWLDEETGHWTGAVGQVQGFNI